MACLYLSIDGAFDISTVQNAMAGSHETCARVVIPSWNFPNAFRGNGVNEVISMRYTRLICKSCPPLKVKYGSFKIMKRDNGIEWIDSLIDSKVTLL